MTQPSGHGPRRSRDDLEREIEILEAENARLRVLLGVIAPPMTDAPRALSAASPVVGITLFGARPQAAATGI